MLKEKLNRIKALIIKEFLTLFRDPRSRVILIGPPLLQLFIFSFAVTLEVKNVHLAVYNSDKAKHSYEIVERLKASKTFSRIDFIDSRAALKKGIDEQRYIAALSFPGNFSRELAQGASPELQIILDGRKSNAAQIVSGYLNRIINNYSNEIFNISKPKISIENRNWFNENLLYLWFTLPSLVGILTMLISLIITALSVARERELGTFDQLLVSPLKPSEILFGKLSPAVIFAMFEGMLMFCLSILIFKVPFHGSVLLFMLSLCVFSLSVVGIGLFISSLCETQQQAILGTFMFMVPAVTLSGYAAPIENMPGWLQPFTWFNPLKHFLVISKGLYLKAMSFNLVIENLIPLVIISFITLSLANWFFSHKLK